MSCEFRRNENCVIAERLAGEPVMTCHDGVCEACVLDIHPKAENKTTISIAVYHLNRIGKRNLAKALADRSRHNIPNQQPVTQSKDTGPSITQRLKNYIEALRRWSKAGYPTRTTEEAQAIFEKHCLMCDQYSKEKRICLHVDCGCHISGQYQKPQTRMKNIRRAMSDKLLMATESCPLNKWSEYTVANTKTQDSRHAQSS